MKYYTIAISLATAIVVVAIIWITWGIDLSAFTTDLSGGPILPIPAIFGWAYAMERRQKRTLKISKK